MMAKGAQPDTIERVTGVIMSGATVIAYILAEGYIDGKRESSDVMYVEQMPGLGTVSEIDVSGNGVRLKADKIEIK